MKNIKLFLVAIILITMSSCNNDNPPATSGGIRFDFTHNWDGDNLTADDFGIIQFTNADGIPMSISKLRYLISNITLHKPDGSTLPIDGYLLVDLSTQATFAFVSNIPFDTYTSISFTFGFDEADNIDGFYADLNSASWNWPEALGGGYHFMQLEGKYLEATIENPYAYHMGTAKLAPGVFEANHFEVFINGFTHSSDATVEIKMNVAEWFKNPYTWDLSTYNIDLMSNYDAQILMNENGDSVFSLGEVN
ncbi:MAG: hypothetical protein COB73_06060 [Flavobacteriaceae bacterium]|nr:MAG: hypothetical protein COB73_06060 [Flavobacteriaceae bacterium]